MENNILWKNIFNSGKAFGSYKQINDAAIRARSCGYFMFSWNGDLYSVNDNYIITMLGSFEELGL